ncbi:MAG TPA: N-acetylmuramoyl-L-alanine amidase [Rhodopila sp.]
MSSAPAVTRRLLLRQFSAGMSIFGTFLLPPVLHDAMARAAVARDTMTLKPGPTGKGGPHDRPFVARPVPLVMLDPGHGGKDPGAIGISGTYEKQVALAAALELKRQLEAGGRYRVELTRTKDVFIPLDGRVEYAQRRGASLFVSMHADALSDHTVRGASVYTLAQTASDAQTAALARKENSADRFIGRQWQAASPEVSHILASLVRQETRVGSVRIARNLVGSLDQDLPMLQNPDRHAGFVVLKAADIPSVLVEMGFMSNPRDEAALRRADHRKLVAQAMHRAVDGFFAGTGHVADSSAPNLG